MKDKCIMCGKETPYDVHTHIDMRIGYVEGAGQLCRDCIIDKEDDYPTESKDICVSSTLIQNTPNDQELGEKVRHLYFSTR
jgi:hypothetical protein